jgi:xylose isomerase
VGHALAFITTLEHPELVGVNPEVGHEQMSNLNVVHGVSQALFMAKLFHIDLNAQRGTKFDQDLRFGSEDQKGALLLVDLLERGGYEGPRHFDCRAYRTEDSDGVWDFARGCMRNYLVLRERAASFRSDPEVHAAMAEAGVGDLAIPTLGPTETWADLRNDSFDADERAKRGAGFERLDQLLLDHLFGVH